MDNQFEMFPLDEFEQQTPQNDRDGIEEDAERIPEPNTIEVISNSSEPQQPDDAEIAVPDLQGSTDPDGEGTSEQLSVRKTSSVFEATGLTGDFQLSDLAFAFPDTSHEDIVALSRDIEATGLLEEITLAWPEEPGGPPEVVDGKRRLRACKMAGVEPTYRLLRRDIDPRRYVWSKNGERRDLTPSQRALAFALLFPKRGPGRPPATEDNCRNSDNFSNPTQGQGAKAKGVGRDLINQAYKVVDSNGRVAPEIRDAVQAGTVSINDALSEKVINASQEVQRQALSQVKDGSSTTIARAINKMAKESPQRDQQPLSRLHTPTRFGKGSQFYCCPVDDLKRSVKPGTVDLLLVHLPAYVRIGFYSQIAELADHVLRDSGVLVVAVVADAALPERLDRVSRGGQEFIGEFSLLFPAPIAELGDPHYTDIRRVALLVLGKHAATLPPGGDVIEVPAPADVPGDGLMEITDGLPLLVARFANGGSVCIPNLSDNRGSAVAAVKSGCTVIAADEDQSVIDDVVREFSGLARDSSNDPDSE